MPRTWCRRPACAPFAGIGGFAGVNARAWLLTITRHAAYTWLSKNRSAALLVVDDLEAVEQKQAATAARAGCGPKRRRRR